VHGRLLWWGGSAAEAPLSTSLSPAPALRAPRKWGWPSVPCPSRNVVRRFLAGCHRSDTATAGFSEQGPAPSARRCLSAADKTARRPWLRQLMISPPAAKAVDDKSTPRSDSAPRPGPAPIGGVVAAPTAGSPRSVPPLDYDAIGPGPNIGRVLEAKAVLARLRAGHPTPSGQSRLGSVPARWERTQPVRRQQGASFLLLPNIPTAQNQWPAGREISSSSPP